MFLFRNEIYVMTGLNKDKGKESRNGENQVSNSFWVYEISSSRWGLIYKNENYEPDYWTNRQIIEPRPRYNLRLYILLNIDVTAKGTPINWSTTRRMEFTSCSVVIQEAKKTGTAN